MKHLCKEVIRGSMRPLRPLAECLEMLKGNGGGLVGVDVPIGSMGLVYLPIYIYTHEWLIFMVNSGTVDVGIYTIRGCYGGDKFRL